MHQPQPLHLATSRPKGLSRFFMKPSSHPTLTTHLQLSEAEQFTICVTADYVRLSASIEDVSDLIAELDQALQQSV